MHNRRLFGWLKACLTAILLFGCVQFFNFSSAAFADDIPWQGTIDGNIYIPETVQNVGVGTTAPGAKVHVSNGAFLVEGDTGTIEGLDDLDALPRLMWLPEIAAFRVGDLTSSTAWDTANLGIGSIGLGGDTLAYGDYSIAIGSEAEANNGGLSLGVFSKASGLYSLAVGQQAETNGILSTTIGFASITDSNTSITIGNGIRNTVAESLMIGFGSTSDPKEEPSLFADKTGVAINGIPDASGTRYALAVYGTVKAEEIIVDTNWADYVFQEDYQLPSLEHVATFIKENKHLPDVPSQAQVKQEGLKMADMMTLHMKKIEELTLYAIQLKKENDVLKAALQDNQNQLTQNQQEFNRRLQSLESSLSVISKK